MAKTIDDSIAFAARNEYKAKQLGGTPFGVSPSYSHYDTGTKIVKRKPRF
jgi:hypothetical protein